MDPIPSFGAWLKRRRKALDLTQDGLAQLVGCAVVTIRKLEAEVQPPSRQLAERLAEQLAIPAEQHATFIRFARLGLDAPPPELPLPPEARVPEPPPAFPALSPPVFLSTAPVHPTTFPPFVARERELAQLDAFLEPALSGQGRVVFVTGEAGSGKTTLVDAFTRQATQHHSDVIVASGSCQAYIGLGDPYLPFREILGLLTGDIEARWRAGMLHREHAERLWTAMPLAVQALVTTGANLVNTFISGVALARRAASVAAGGANWLTQLHQIVIRKEAGHDRTDVTQSNLFEQYTQVVQRMAQQRPLLLVLDDLQWADIGSLSLLFHLGRRLDGHRILVVGIYRPADVALGRAGDRHPLEPIVNEFERHFGPQHVSLRQAADKQFVEQFLDTEPNRLSAGFREALYQHTRGHALFTVEIVRGMQERGGLIPDQADQWVEGPSLDWETLPNRVESVIGERIKRLPTELQELLNIASVAGETFTAEVVARVQGVGEREIVRQLSSELDKQHRLVRAQDSQRVGSQRLSHYRFRHILFQRYLYHSLDDVERAYLHEAIATAIEQVYGERTAEVALQLARHFQSAGLPSKAIGYLQTAGDAAVLVFATAEAAALYRQALALATPAEVSSETLFNLYNRLGRVLEFGSEFEQAQATYEELKQFAHRRGDRAMALAALMAQATLHAAPNRGQNLAQGQALSEQALALARELGDRAGEAKILSNLVTICRFSNRLAQAIDYGERALALARQLNLGEQLALTLNDLARCYGLSGHLDRSTVVSREAIDRWRELGNLPKLADSLGSTCVFRVFAGDYDQVIADAEEAWQISQAIHNVWNQSYSRMTVGAAYWERGQLDQALAVMEESIRLSEVVGFAVPQVLTQADLAAVYAELGAVERGLEIVQRALTAAQTRVPVYRGYVLATLAHIYLAHDDLGKAEAIIGEARHDQNQEAIPLFAVLIVQAESELALRQGHYQQALAATDSVLTTMRQFGMRRLIPRLLYLHSQALLALGDEQKAREYLREACTTAEAMAARRQLWPILFALSRLEGDTIAAEQLRGRAQEIIEDLADHTPTPELRMSFLNLPYVRAVFEPPVWRA